MLQSIVYSIKKIIIKLQIISVLVGMLTTDAASFGQAGLYGIKVVEVRGNSMQPYVNVNFQKKVINNLCNFSQIKRIHKILQIHRRLPSIINYINHHKHNQHSINNYSQQCQRPLNMADKQQFHRKHNNNKQYRKFCPPQRIIMHKIVMAMNICVNG